MEPYLNTDGSNGLLEIVSTRSSKAQPTEVRDIEFETTVTKTSDGTYNVTAEQVDATTSGAFLGAQLGAAAAAAAMSSPARAATPVLALAAVAAAAGVAMHRSRRASRASDEDPLLFKGAKYGAASV